MTSSVEKEGKQTGVRGSCYHQAKEDDQTHPKTKGLATVEKDLKRSTSQGERPTSTEDAVTDNRLEPRQANSPYESYDYRYIQDSVTKLCKMWKSQQAALGKSEN